MKILKKYYMVLLLILCLSGVVIYGTYAMFTAVVESNNVVGMDTNLNYTFEMNDNQTLKVSGKSKMRFNAIVKNNMGGAMNYGLYYKMISPDALPDGVIIAEVTDTSTLTTSGEIGEGASKVIPIIINNTTNTEVQVEIGVRMGYVTQRVENIVYNDGEINITRTQTSEEAGSSECNASITCKTYIGNDNKKYDCVTGEEISPSDEMLTYLQTTSGDTAGFTSNGEKTSFDSVATINEGIFEAPDDYGTSYYWRGAVNNNYLKFGKDATSGQDLWWRIIRINGDGSIRIIYNGTSSAQTGTSTQLSTSAYNTNYNKNAYVGYTYGTPGSGSYDGEHHGTNPSTIKGVVDTWYENNIKGKYDDYISNTSFCADKTSTTNSSATSITTNSGGYGPSTTTVYYGGYARLINAKTPKLTCPQKIDSYTTSEDTDHGNGYLKYPVGLIAADEVAMAGGVYGTNNTSYYLYTNQHYWTISPSFFSGYLADVFSVYSNGYLDRPVVSNSDGVRPVVSLKSSVKLTGKGTSSEPFVVEGAV